MCTHKYVDLPRKKSPSCCPYPEMLEGLPLDSLGVCIFHSNEIAWKRTSSFVTWFAKLLRQIEHGAQETDEFYFRDFIIVGNEASLITLPKRTFKKKFDFTGAQFLDPVAWQNTRFASSMGVSFASTHFHSTLKIEDVHFRGADFTGSTFGDSIRIQHTHFKNSYAIFDRCTFNGNVIIHDTIFDGIAMFTDSVFGQSSRRDSHTSFSDINFLDVVDFSNAIFHCHVSFEEVRFHYHSEFVDTQFRPIESTIRYRTPAVNFANIQVSRDGSLTLKSSDQAKKMFQQEVGFKLKTDPEGIIYFENVNFSNIKQRDRNVLLRLSREGKVSIGSGCIKYRHQTPLKTIRTEDTNHPLIEDLTQTFTHYFVARNGINLGFEIVERSTEKISFFYFTDENITEDEFLGRLGHTERDLWSLLTMELDGRYLTTQGEDNESLVRNNEDSILTMVDGLSALLGTFFRVGIRIALGRWRQMDTQALIGAVSFGDQAQQIPFTDIHRALMERYTGQSLFRINSNQNANLLPLLSPGAPPPPLRNPEKEAPRERTKILFLGVYSSSEKSPDVVREMEKIQSNLRLSKERDYLELIPILEPTADRALQLILDEEPNIVHFSGHGHRKGIVLLDENGRSALVSNKAISSLFRLAKRHIFCVLLNSCYSKSQAEAIHRHIPYVIAMNSSISDAAAIAFSTGFYKGIGSGREVPTAFKIGVLSMQLAGIDEDDIPELLTTRQTHVFGE